MHWQVKECERFEMNVDIPKSTVFVLLVLTIIISVLGTWSVLDNLKAEEKLPQVQEAKIALIIAPPETARSSQLSPATGFVGLEINKEKR